MVRLFGWLLAALLTGAATPPSWPPPEWSQPTAPFRVVGQIYYVGTQGIAAYLIRTNDGLILLDGGLEHSAHDVERSVRQLGFDLHDIKIMIATHAHWDHAGALAKLKRDTGATFLSSAKDRQAYETGKAPSEISGGTTPFPPVKVDQLLVDGQPVRLGDTAITPLLTPGHTPGCTSWMMTVSEEGKPLDVALLCSLSVAGNKLVSNRGYPAIVTDFRETFARLRRLQADVVLTSHPERANIIGRAQDRDAGNAKAFIEPSLLPEILGESEAAFEKELKKEEAP